MLLQRGFEIDPVVYQAAPKPGRIRQYKWKKTQESAQVNQCIDWMKKYIGLPAGMDFENISSQSNTLDFPAGTLLNFTIRGTSDVAIANNLFVGGQVINGTHILFELKKAIKRRHHYQAVLETFASNGISSFPVMVVLTDLKLAWCFYWLEEKKVKQLRCGNIQEAVAIIESALTDGAPQNTPEPNAPPFSKRINLKTRSDAKGEVPIRSFQEVLEMVKKRRKVEPPVDDDDVAQMSDVFDVMDEEEIRAWKMKQWGRVIMKTPYLQPLLAELKKESS